MFHGKHRRKPTTLRGCKRCPSDVCCFWLRPKTSNIPTLNWGSNLRACVLWIYWGSHLPNGHTFSGMGMFMSFKRGENKTWESNHLPNRFGPMDLVLPNACVRLLGWSWLLAPRAKHVFWDKLFGPVRNKRFTTLSQCVKYDASGKKERNLFNCMFLGTPPLACFGVILFKISWPNRCWPKGFF